MNVVHTKQLGFCDKYSQVIEKKLNHKQSDVLNIMKIEFKGKKLHKVNDFNFKLLINHVCLSEMYEINGLNIPLSNVTSCRNKSDECVGFFNNYVALVVE